MEDKSITILLIEDDSDDTLLIRETLSEIDPSQLRLKIESYYLFVLPGFPITPIISPLLNGK